MGRRLGNRSGGSDGGRSIAVAAVGRRLVDSSRPARRATRESRRAWGGKAWDKSGVRDRFNRACRVSLRVRRVSQWTNDRHRFLRWQWRHCGILIQGDEQSDMLSSPRTAGFGSHRAKAFMGEATGTEEVWGNQQLDCRSQQPSQNRLRESSTYVRRVLWRHLSRARWRLQEHQW